MEIHKITIAQLPEFIQSDAFRKLKIIPITDLRAISQVNNPHASPNDTALIYAEDENKTVALVGALPGTLKNEKIYWNSCWWTAQNYNHLAVPLFLEFIKLAGQKVLITDLTPHTFSIVQQLSFFKPITFPDGVRAYLKYNFKEWLPQKNPAFQSTLVLWKFLDATLNLFAFIKSSCYKPKTKGLTLEEITAFNETDSTFIQSLSKNDNDVRTTQELMWVKNFPWITTKPKVNNHYPFTYGVKQLVNKWIRIKENGQLKAILYFIIKDKKLTTPFLYFEPDFSKMVVEVIKETGLQNQIIHYTTFNQQVAEALKANKKPFFMIRNIPRTFVAHQSVAHLVNPDKNLQDGAGDLMFC